MNEGKPTGSSSEQVVSLEKKAHSDLLTAATLPQDGCSKTPILNPHGKATGLQQQKTGSHK